MLLILSQNQTMFRYIKLYLDIFSCLFKFIAEHFLWKRGFMLGTNLRQSLQTFFRGGFKRFCVLNFICVLNDKTFPIRFILNYCCCFCKNLVFCVYICLFFPDNYTTSQMYSAKHDIEIFHLKCIILKSRGEILRLKLNLVKNCIFCRHIYFSKNTNRIF